MLVQRVAHASVEVNDQCVGHIKNGLMVLVGVGQGDEKSIADRMIEKLIHLRIFNDEHGKMNRSVIDCGGSLLLVSQFTLFADCQRGRRPAFTSAASPDLARELFHYAIDRCLKTGVPVQHGVFAADMKVTLLNDGPVTILLDSDELFGTLENAIA